MGEGSEGTADVDRLVEALRDVYTPHRGVVLPCEVGVASE